MERCSIFAGQRETGPTRPGSVGFESDFYMGGECYQFSAAMREHFAAAADMPLESGNACGG
jgi:hypothetical protein